MKDFRGWRKMTWALVAAAVLGAVWVVLSGYSMFILGVSLGALGVLWVLWYFTEPLWRQGRGAHVRRRHAPAVEFKPVRSLVDPRD